MLFVGETEHKIEEFTTRFSRPSDTPNQVHGCPCFISLDDFRRRYGSFIRDDTMMLEIRVLQEGGILEERPQEEEGGEKEDGTGDKEEECDAENLEEGE